MSGERQHNNTYPPVDAETVLEDGLVAIAADRNGKVATVDRILDLGDDGFDSVDGHGAYIRGEIVFNVTEFDFTTADETVDAIVQLSLEADFGSDIIERARLHFGDAQDGADIDLPAATDGAVRIVLPIDNEINGVRYRYMRLRFIVGGTTPSFLGSAFFTKQLQLAG